MISSKLLPMEIENIKKGAKIWQSIRKDLTEFVKPGVTGKEIDLKALELFHQYGVKTAFHNYHNFPGNICVSVNDCIIHGVGNDIPLKPEDKVTLDVGFKCSNIFIDSAFTLIVDPASNPEYSFFIECGKKALWEGIKAVKPNCTQGDISSAIENYVLSLKDKINPLSIIDGFVGHAIGTELHSKPHIFNKGYKPGMGERISPGLVICIEPMLMTQSTGEFKKGVNGFDIFSKTSGAMTCHWEHMVLVKEDGIEVLTASEEEIKEYFG